MLELNKIYLGDCLNLMPQIADNSVDMVITDPPYINENHGGGKSEMAKRKLVKERHIDFISNGFDYNMVFGEFIRICKTPNILLFCSNKQVSKVMSWFESKNLPTTLLVWHKTNPIPFANGKHLSDVEFLVYVHGKGATFNNDVPYKYKSKVYSSPIVSNKNRLHPTQKNVEQLRQYIKTFTKPNDVILDCFCGSGSTIVAAIRENRQYIGIEKDEHYFEITKQRIAADASQLSLFNNLI